jgi:D-glycero-D-manno-heptose 1,7-bisphosphate phosphatase
MVMTPAQNKAVFLDRDGVINRERGDYTWRWEDFELNEGVEKALQEFLRRGYLLIVISNQGGIGKGLYTVSETDALHARMEASLLEKGIRLTAIYFCPHHPSVSRCLCRKPESLMIEKALARYALDPSACYFIGDAERDAAAGRAAGVRTLLIPPNSSLMETLDVVE